MNLRPQCPPEPTRAEQTRESRVESAWDNIASDSGYLAEAIAEHPGAIRREQLELICSLAQKASWTPEQARQMDDIYWQLAAEVAA